ncbi:hypothetical protein [Halobacillus sp. B29]|uniref:hypothetical protein n=1 Tax=Halobacillus sp. B29 TaxID=3457432 RepID=UPI003FCD1F4D
MSEEQLDLKFLKEMYHRFKGTSEENIKIYVVTWFLEMLGCKNDFDIIKFFNKESIFENKITY